MTSTRYADADSPAETVDQSDAPAWARRVFSEGVFNFAVATAALLIMALPVGLATIWLGFIRGESPCTLCGYERFGMVVVAVAALMILRYGPHRKYVFTIGMAGFFFIYTTIRHWSIHMADDRGQGLAESIMGAHTYTWGILTFWAVIAAASIGLLWIGFDPKLHAQFGAATPVPQKLNGYAMVSGIVVFAMICLNSVQFFLLNGPPPFAGTGQPPRFTLNVARAAENWSLGIWSRFGVPSLHSNTPPTPHVPGVNTVAELGDAADAAPIATSGSLEVLGSMELGFDAVGPFGGQAGGIAYDESSGLFGIVSTGGGFYYVEDDFSTVVSHAVFDTVNGYNVAITTDAMFIGPEQLVATAWNKTVYGTVRVGPGEVDEFTDWKEYRDSSGDLEPIFGSKIRHRLQTVQAKYAYTLAAAMDQDSGLYSLVSVPWENSDKIVISQFGEDNFLQRENVLAVGEGVEISDEADLTSYYPVGAEIVDGQMYLLSATHQTLLVVDMETVTVTDALELPDIGDYHDLAAAEGSLWVLSDVDGVDTVFELSMP